MVAATGGRFYHDQFILRMCYEEIYKILSQPQELGISARVLQSSLVDTK